MSREFRVGLLALAGVALFVLVLFTIANRSFLLSDTFLLRARFNRVAGLVPGAPVQFQGVNVGRVESVQLPLAPGGQIEVTMAIKETARRVIHRRTQAQIKSEGLVGQQIVVLVNPAGVDGEPVVEGDLIVGVDPFDLFEITDRALASVQTFEQAAEAFRQIMHDVQAGQGTLGKLIYDPALYNEFVATTSETRRVLNNLANNAEALVALADEATQGVKSILEKIDQGDGSLARLLNDPALYVQLLATVDTLRMVATDLRAITGAIENAAHWGTLGAYRFAELMEAAKHNWLFRRYFEERGYMEQAPFEVRERAIEQSYRQLEARMRELQAWEQALQAREARLKALEARIDSLADVP
ncbi:MlaD family protein [Rhodothermus bifroesti]|uniref:MCE family protein n=1 Tax=Rhodothermus marinus TaxID=29549 RepID=A0A7V2F624_RHOMR|nr:MlaD family protein [Rhodothermus bifroesti]